jgi:hypothetical protein
MLFRNISLPATDIAMFDTTPPPPPGSANATPAADFEQCYNATRLKVFEAFTAGLAFVLAATTVTVTTRTRVFVYNFAWLGALLLALATLFAASTVALALQLRCTLALNMLRYVASMTYTNRHFHMPAGGSALDGMARAQLLHDVPVRIGDITRGDGTGADEVVFAATSDAEVYELTTRRCPTSNA